MKSSALSASSSSSIRVLVALAVGICIGIALGTVWFTASASSTHCTGDSAASEPSTKVHQPSPRVVVTAAATKSTQEDTSPQPLQPLSSSASYDFLRNWSAHCESTFDIDAIKARATEIATSTEGKSIFNSRSLHDTVSHFRSAMGFLRDPASRECWERIVFHRKQQQKQLGGFSSFQQHFFFDLGSRKLDQTTTFLRMYPQAGKFTVVCYEPNPKFNGIYRDARATNPKLFHVNAAVGIVPDTLLLSDRDVGSSIVVEKVHQQQEQQQQRQNNGTVVKVVPFLDALLFGGNKQHQQQQHPSPKSFRDKVVVKMDVEKAEFAILHTLVRSGALSLISELLLECHYNTNLPREQRDPKLHIGLDDCTQLVNDLRVASGGTMEVVLWNSVKTAQRTGRGYMERHGGFYPT